MSSAGYAGGAAAPLRYFCHQCNRTVTLTASPALELSCPICHGGFLEEINNPNCNPSPSPFMAFPASSDPVSSSTSAFSFPFLFSATSGSVGLRNPSDLSPDPSLFRPLSSSPGAGAGSGPDPFNPVLFFQNYIQTLLSSANVQVVFDGSGGPFPGTNLGDYFIGPGFEQLIEQLAENDPNRHGTPPAAKSSVESLPDIKISEDLLASDEAQCAVCRDTFEIGARGKQLPCKHIYHGDCILPWLELHNTCPVCRYELPTDDPDYEQKRRGEHSPPEQTTGAGDLGGAGAAPAATPGEGNSPVRIVDRRMRISLPWPFRAFGSQAEASNGGSQSGRDEDSGRGDHGN